MPLSHILDLLVPRKPNQTIAKIRALNPTTKYRTSISEFGLDNLVDRAHLRKHSNQIYIRARLFTYGIILLERKFKVSSIFANPQEMTKFKFIGYFIGPSIVFAHRKIIFKLLPLLLFFFTSVKSVFRLLNSSISLK